MDRVPGEDDFTAARTSRRVYACVFDVLSPLPVAACSMYRKLALYREPLWRFAEGGGGGSAEALEGGEKDGLPYAIITQILSRRNATLSWSFRSCSRLLHPTGGPIAPPQRMAWARGVHHRPHSAFAQPHQGLRAAHRW
jgi:hypothetical protein